MLRSLLLSITFIPSLAFAHGDSPSFEQQKGDYLIDIGYSVEGFRPNEEVDFDFDLLLNAEGRSPDFVPFETIDVSITKGETEVFADTLQNEKNFIPRMSYTFAEPGDYKLKVAYMTGDTLIAEESFDIPVAETNGQVARTLTTIQYVIAALCVAAAAGYIGLALKRRS